MPSSHSFSSSPRGSEDSIGRMVTGVVKAGMETETGFWRDGVNKSGGDELYCWSLRSLGFKPTLFSRAFRSLQWGLGPTPLVRGFLPRGLGWNPHCLRVLGWNPLSVVWVGIHTLCVSWVGIHTLCVVWVGIHTLYVVWVGIHTLVSWVPIWFGIDSTLYA